MTISVADGKLDTANVKLSTIREELELKHEKTLQNAKSLHEKEMLRIRAEIDGKNRIINQLSEVSERREREVHSLESVDILKTTAMKDLEETMESLRKELASTQSELEKPRVRSIGVTTHTSSTSTHSCATTQTPNVAVSMTGENDSSDSSTETTATTQDAELTKKSPSDLHELCQVAQTSLQALIANVYALDERAAHSTIPPHPVMFQPHYYNNQNPNMVFQPQPLQPPYFHPHLNAHPHPHPQHFARPQHHA